MSEAYKFMPEDVGNMVNPADLPADVADAVLGKPLMDELRKPVEFTPGHWEVKTVNPSNN